jgi:hypothetical protein
MNQKHWLAVGAALVLAACGGGNDDNVNPVPQTPSAQTPSTQTPSTQAPSTQTPSTQAPSAQTMMYEALSNAKTFQPDEANTEGARGWRYLTSMDFALGVASQGGNIYVKDIAATYTYSVVRDAANSVELLAQLNAQGAMGLKYAGPYVISGVNNIIYRKEDGSASTFNYRVLPELANADDLLVQAKAQGAQGYYQMGAPLAFSASDIVRIYEKDSRSNAVYDYAAVPYEPSINPDDFLAQLNEQGRQGFRFTVPYMFDSDPLHFYNLYEKDTMQSATFSYELMDVPDTLADYVEQANAQGARGFTLLGPFTFYSAGVVTKAIYMKPTDCTGFICLGRGSFGF